MRIRFLLWNGEGVLLLTPLLRKKHMCWTFTQKHTLNARKHSEAQIYRTRINNRVAVVELTSVPAVQPGCGEQVRVAGDGGIWFAAEGTGLLRAWGVRLVTLGVIGGVWLQTERLWVDLLQLPAFQPDRLCTPGGIWRNWWGYGEERLGYDDVHLKTLQEAHALGTKKLREVNGMVFS